MNLKYLNIDFELFILNFLSNSEYLKITHQRCISFSSLRFFFFEDFYKVLMRYIFSTWSSKESVMKSIIIYIKYLLEFLKFLLLGLIF